MPGFIAPRIDASVSRPTCLATAPLVAWRRPKGDIPVLRNQGTFQLRVDSVKRWRTEKLGERPIPGSIGTSGDVGKWASGGESGIRTHGTLARTHAFQACALSRSAISPALAVATDSSASPPGKPRHRGLHAGNSIGPPVCRAWCCRTAAGLAAASQARSPPRNPDPVRCKRRTRPALRPSPPGHTPARPAWSGRRWRPIPSPGPSPRPLPRPCR